MTWYDWEGKMKTRTICHGARGSQNGLFLEYSTVSLTDRGLHRLKCLSDKDRLRPTCLITSCVRVLLTFLSLRCGCARTAAVVVFCILQHSFSIKSRPRIWGLPWGQLFRQMLGFAHLSAMMTLLKVKSWVWLIRFSQSATGSALHYPNPTCITHGLEKCSFA